MSIEAGFYRDPPQHWNNKSVIYISLNIYFIMHVLLSFNTCLFQIKNIFKNYKVYIRKFVHFRPTKVDMFMIQVCIHISQGVLGIFWFRFFQKHQIWPRDRPCHTVQIFDGRQDRSLTGRPYWRNPKWPPSWWDVNCSSKAKRARITNDTSI